MSDRHDEIFSSRSRRDPVPIDAVIDTYLASEGMSSLRLLDAIERSWTEVAGQEFAEHSAPRALRGTELVVAVDTPGRVTELAFVAPGICERLAELLGKRVVERVKGQVDGRFRLE